MAFDVEDFEEAIEWLDGMGFDKEFLPSLNDECKGGVVFFRFTCNHSEFELILKVV